MREEEGGVPPSDVRELSPRKSDFCVAVFVINEGGLLTRQLERMRPLASEVDIVVADGGSTDGSVDPEVLARAGVNALLVKRGAGKLGAQMRMAFAWALDRGYRGIVVVDGNGKDSVENIPDFVARLREGYDHVQGSRFIRGGISKNLPFTRWLGLRLIHAPLLSLASGFRYTDTTNGFRAYSARLIADPGIDVFRAVFSGYELHYYLAVAAARRGFRVTEIPVSRCYPKGKVPTKISPIRGNFEVLRRLLAVVLNRYSP